MRIVHYSYLQWYDNQEYLFVSVRQHMLDEKVASTNKDNGCEQ